jgi:hypothetical protein
MRLESIKHLTSFLVIRVLIIYSFWFSLGLKAGSPKISVRINDNHFLSDPEIRNWEDLGIIGVLSV